MLRASAGAPLTEDDVDRMDAYTLGETFAEEEKAYLMPRIVALNGAITEHLMACHRYWLETGVEVRPSCAGNGLFAGALVGKAKEGDVCAMYFGTLEIDDRFTGRRDYAIQLPSLRLSDGAKPVKIILCGYAQRNVPLNAVMLNHSCGGSNAVFELRTVTIYKDLVARCKLRAARKKNPYNVPAALVTAGDAVFFEYFVVVARLVKDVPPGEEFRVSYDRIRTNGRLDYRRSYFMSRKAAQSKKTADEEVVSCLCVPAGGGKPAHCPWDRAFVINRAFLPPPP